MLKIKNVDITGGPIFKSIILYALPVMIGSLIQMLFNAADLLVLGNMADEIAFASVGATAAIIGLLVNSFVGLSAGVSVVLARCIGQKNDKRAGTVVSTSVITSVFLGIMITLLLLFSSGFFLRITECPEECVEGASVYLKVYAVGILPMMIYNFGAAIIRTTGDTSRPLYYLIIAGICNVVLNLVLCFLLEQKVAAVAAATAFSQFLGAILVVIRLCRIEGSCRLSLKGLRYSFTELGNILKIGVPCGFNSALFALSNLQIQAAVNSFGPAATAGGSACGTVESLVGSLSSSFSAAAVPFVGQNVGAGNRKRVRNSIIVCAIIAPAIGFVFGNLIYIFGEDVLSLFLPDSAEAVAFGMVRMKYVLCAYGICMLYNVLVSVMQAFGYSFVPMLNSILTVLGFRLIWMEFIYPPLNAANRVIDNLYVCYTISWTLCLIAHSVAFAIIYSRYRKGVVRRV